MKETNLNQLQQEIETFMLNNEVAILEDMRWNHVVAWFLTVYSQLDAVKEVTLRFQEGFWYDFTIITTMHRLTIIDNQTESMSYAKTEIDMVLYDDLLQDLTNLCNYLNMVYLRLGFV